MAPINLIPLMNYQTKKNGDCLNMDFLSKVVHKALSLVLLAYMKCYSEKILAGVGLAVLFSAVCYAEVLDRSEASNVKQLLDTKAVLSAECDKHNKRDKKEFELLTDINAKIEIAGVSGGDYAFKTVRQIHFDIWKMQEWFVHFGIEEKSLFSPSPSQLDHEIAYFEIGRETAKGRIKFFWDHTCNNPSRKLSESKSNGIPWNE